MSSLRPNPLLVKEFRTRLRARTATIVVLLQSAILAAMAALLLLTQRGSPAWEVGSGLFKMLLYAQTMALFFLAPLVAASVISAEKEQKTYDSLMVTPVSPRMIVFAKLASALAVFVLLLAIALPFAVATYLLGGVAPDRLMLGWLYILLLTAAASAMGIYWSTRFERSIASIPAAAVCTLGLGFLFPMMAQGTSAVVAGISPILFLQAFLEGKQSFSFFGMNWPEWSFVFILLALAGFAICTAAVQRIKPVEDRRYVLMRLFSLAGLTVAALGVMGETAGPAGDLAAARRIVGETGAMLLAPLCLMAPWIGASMPVIRSERHPPDAPGARRKRLHRAFARALTGPAGYPLSMALIACAILYGLRRFVWQGRGLPEHELAGIYASIVFVPAAYAMLAYRLADRRRTRGRFIGLAVAWLIAAGLLFAPWAVFEAGRFQGEFTAWPLAARLYTLTSPLTLASLFGSYRHPAFAAVHAAIGNDGLWMLAPGLHALLLGILLLPVYPGKSRNRSGQTDQMQTS